VYSMRRAAVIAWVARSFRTTRPPARCHSLLIALPLEDEKAARCFSTPIPKAPMTDPREQAHHLIDRLPETQLSALVGLLETMVDPVAAALCRAPIDDEPETDGESRPWPKRATGLPERWQGHPA